MRLTGSIPLSLAAFGLVAAALDEAAVPAPGRRHRIEILSDTDYSIFVTRKEDLIPRMGPPQMHSLSHPQELSKAHWLNHAVGFPPPKGGGLKSGPKIPLSLGGPNPGRPKGNPGKNRGKPGWPNGNPITNPLANPLGALGSTLGNTIGNTLGNLGKPPFAGTPKGPISGRRGTKCTTQQVQCKFLKDAAYKLQNDDDECVKIATTFDDQGRIKFDPIMQDRENIIYGLTTDGLTASAWCNDIGWALRKIYTSCRKRVNGKDTCYGGDSYAARNTAFLVSVGPRLKNT